MRRHTVQIRLDDSELGRLDAIAAERRSTRSDVLRAAIGPGESPPVSRTFALERLATAAQRGSVAAAVALERALRIEEPPPTFQPGPVGLDALDADDLGGLRVVQ